MITCRKQMDFLHGNAPAMKHIHRNARSWCDVAATAAMSIVNALELAGIEHDN